jgi:hypothetical protein
MGIQDGWLNANEVRAMEDLNPQPGEQGDTFFVPMNMAPKDQIIDGTYSTSSPPAISTEQPPESETVEYIEQSGSGQLTEAQYFGVQLREYRRSAYRGEIEAKVQDIVSKQISVIETALPVLSETGADAFYAQVRKAFEELEAETAEKFRPLFSGIAGDIIPDLQNEVRNAADISADVESFLDDYTSTFTKRINASNRGQIEKLVRDTPQSEVVSAITTRLGEWREKEAAKITSDEIVRVSDAVARTAYGALGVQYLRWVTRGSETCPYCQAMSGKIVGVSQPFISRGNEMVPEGKARGMRFSHDVRHAPLHQGCDCTIVASQ